MSQVVHALSSLIERWNGHYSIDANNLPRIEQDEQWPSVCEVAGSVENGEVAWQPVKNDKPGSFDNIEHALEMTLHPDIKSYYTEYWSGELALKHEKGPVFLLQLWNEQDLANLQENIIGHMLMKRRLKQQPTVFFGLTDEEDLLISMVNDSGEIWLESVGCEPHLKLADSMSDFLDMLSV